MSSKPSVDWWKRCAVCSQPMLDDEPRSFIGEYDDSDEIHQRCEEAFRREWNYDSRNGNIRINGEPISQGGDAAD